MAANASTIASTVLEERADCGDTATAANMAVTDKSNSVGSAERAVEVTPWSLARIAVNTTSVNAAASGHRSRVG